MAEEKKPEEKVYCGCLPKSEIPKFIETFKKGLTEGQKFEDKKKFNFEIRGTEAEPQGITFELFSVNKENYGQYVDPSKDYMAKALGVFTVSINAKDESSVKVLEELFEKMKPLLLEIPTIKKHPDQYQIHFRTSGKKVSIDVISVTGQFLQPLLDLGIDMSEYHNFKAGFKSEFKPDEFFTLKIEELVVKALQFVLSAKGESTNFRYILTALIEALKEIKLQKNQEKLDKIVSYLDGLNSFVSFLLEFKFDAKELSGSGLEIAKAKGFDISAKFEQFRIVLNGLIDQFVKPTLTSMGLIDAAKVADVDEINISYLIPKYSNGVAQLIKLPGFTKYFQEKILA
jgi:hypothetical protein